MVTKSLAQLVRARAGHAALALLCLAILFVGWQNAGHGIQSVDVRTYVEMMRGIHRTGLPVVDNGPVGELRVLEVPWNIWHDGRLWGTYPPLYPYLVAPLMGWGLHAVSLFTYAILVPLALVTYALARRVLVTQRYAVVAAFAVVFATPMAGNAFALAAYPLAVLLVTASVLAAMEATRRRGRARLAWGALVGFCAALATASHLLCFPMGLATIGSLAIADTAAPREDRGPAFLRGLRSFWPDADGIRSALAAVAGLVVGLLPVAILNRIRFGTYSPLTYGTMPWHGSEWNLEQTLGKHLGYAAGPLAVAAVVVAGWVASGWLTGGRARAKWPIRVLVVAGAAALVARNADLLEHSRRVGRMFYLFAIDTSVPDLEPPYYRSTLGPGNLVGPFVIKAALQCTPLIGLVFVLPKLAVRQRHVMAVLLLPAAALFAALTIRANLPLTIGLGWAWVYMRYTLPAVPLLLVAGLSVIEALRPGRLGAVAALAVGGAMVLFLAQQSGEDGPQSWLRQTLLLRGTIVIAVVGLAAVLLHRVRLLPAHVAGILASLSVGASFGVGIGHDFRCGQFQKGYADWRQDTAAALLPERFGLFGVHWAMDQVLALRTVRDVQYADTAITEKIENMRPVLEHWSHEGRPVFFMTLFEEPPRPSPWPDLEFERLAPDQPIYRVRRIDGTPF